MVSWPTPCGTCPGQGLRPHGASRGRPPCRSVGVVHNAGFHKSADAPRHDSGQVRGLGACDRARRYVGSGEHDLEDTPSRTANPLLDICSAACRSLEVFAGGMRRGLTFERSPRAERSRPKSRWLVDQYGLPGHLPGLLFGWRPRGHESSEGLIG
jgi:hypothetical protein